jgi:trk system potassium uptake protein
MKVLICGAGQVGMSIARQLADEGNDVTVIDQSAELIQKIGDSLEVRGLVGFASYPDVLERAGAADAELLVAVTYSDEVNLIACHVGHTLFNVPTRIARVRAQNYLESSRAALFSNERLAIDAIISPEIEIARAIMRQLQLPGAFDTVPFADGRVRLVGVRLGENCPVLNTPLRRLTELFPDLNVVVTGIVRNDRMTVPSGDDRLLPGDEIYFVGVADQVPRAMTLFGHEEKEARRMIIVGAGNIGLFLAQQLEAEQPSVKLKLIESNKARAELVADQVRRAVVLHGNALDGDILAEANVQSAEAIIALTNDDKVNILVSLLAKRAGCQRAMTLVNNQAYGQLVSSLGVDVVVNPRATTVSTILHHIRRGRIRGVHSLRDGQAEVIEGVALETSGLVGQPLRDVDLPAGIIVGAVVRGEEVIMPRGDTVIEAKDVVIMFALKEAVKVMEKLFAVRLEFF